MLQQKKEIGALEKSDFLGFTPKLLSVLDFRVQHWNNAKMQPITKSRNFSKCFIQLFVNFSSIFGHLLEIFWIIGITFVILITSASSLIGCCRTQMWKCTASFRFFCVWYRRYDILHVKNDHNFPKNQQIHFCTFQKICTFLL